MNSKRDDIMRRRDETDADAPLTGEEFDRRGHAGPPGARRRRLVAGRFRHSIRNSGRVVARLGTGPASAGRRDPELPAGHSRMPEAVAKALHDAA